MLLHIDLVLQGQPFNPGGGVIFVGSDAIVTGLGNPADGTTDTTSFTLNDHPVFVTFFDKGDVNSLNSFHIMLVVEHTDSMRQA